MAYATVQDMMLRYSEAEILEVTTPPGQEYGQIDQAKVQAALNDATDEMDGYLRRRYQTPVPVVPAKMVSVCCALARFNLCESGYVIAGEKVTDAHKGALAWLRGVSAGSIVLEGELQANTSENWAEYQGRPIAYQGRFG
ncbi:gp436 family protein [Gluconobacter japonicus]|uniref:gp436 family protein n=1 Tax=Gluconobacter japonicus TaxID=376620 RepID=UPI003D26A182